MTVAEVEVLVGADVAPLKKGMAEASEVTTKTTTDMGQQVKSLGKSVDGLRESYVAMATGVKRENRETADGIRRDLKDAVDGIRQDVRSMADEFQRSMKKTSDAIDDPAKKLKATEDALRHFGENATAVGQGLTATLTNPLVAAGKAGLGYAGDFQQTMSVFQVTADATAADMAKVSAAAKQLGNDATLPGTSATDAAHAMLELSKAGLTVKDTLSAADGVLRMSAAAQIDNATAAKFTAEALMAFSLEGSKANMVSDLLAASANASTASMTEVAEGLSQSAAVYAHAGVSIQDLVTGLTMLANAGIKGSDAGTSMKQMLIALENPPKEAATEIKNLGVQIYDAQGKMVPFKQIVGQFATATKDLTQKQRDHALATIFGSDAVRAANVVIGQGVDGFTKLEATVTKQGEAAKTAAAYNEGYKGAMDAAKSAGQTMLQDFLEPMLPAATELFKHGSDLLNNMDGWSPAAKTAAVGVGGLLAIVGPGILVVGGFARSISAVIALKGMFVGTQAAEAAAMDGTAAAATTATAAVTAEATATDTAAAAAVASEAALAGEAAAMEGVAGAASGAAAQVGILRGAMAALSGMALPAILTGASVAGVAYMGKDFLNQADQARAANVKGFKTFDDRGVKAAREVYRKFGKAAVLDDYRMRPQADDSFTGRVTYSQDQANRAIQEEDSARQLSRFGWTVDPTKAAGAAKAAMHSDDDDAARAAAARYTRMEAESGKKKGRGGRGGKSDEEKAAAKQAREEASAIKDLQSQYYNAQKAVDLFGKDKESVSLQYDLDHGKILAEGQGIAKNTIARMKDKEALEAWRDAKAAAAARDKEWADAQTEHAKTMGAQAITSNAYQAASLAMFGKKFQDLTDEHSKQKVLWQVEEDRAKAEKDRFEAGQQYAKSTIESLQHELNAKNAITRVEQARLEIAERRAKGETITPTQENTILDNAKLIDNAEWSKEISAFEDSLNAAIDEAVQKTQDAKDKAADASFGRYSDAIAQLQERLSMTGSETSKVQQETVKLALAYGNGATAADRIRDGMGRAKEVMDLTKQVEKAEAWRQEIQGLAQTGAQWFGKMAVDVTNGFDVSFKGILRSFSSMIAQMVQQWAQTQITKSMTGTLTNILGGVFGGGSSSGVTQHDGQDWVGPFSAGPTIKGHATGGPVISDEAVLVGEHGPEIFRPSGNGSIETATATRRMLGGPTVHVTMNVTTPDVGSFKESDTQLALKLGQRINHAMRTVG